MNEEKIEVISIKLVSDCKNGSYLYHLICTDKQLEQRFPTIKDVLEKALMMPSGKIMKIEEYNLSIRRYSGGELNDIFNEFLLSILNTENASVIIELKRRWKEYLSQPIINP